MSEINPQPLQDFPDSLKTVCISLTLTAQEYRYLSNRARRFGRKNAQEVIRKIIQADMDKNILGL